MVDERSKRGQFIEACLAATTAASAWSSGVSPPNPSTQVRYMGAVLLPSIALAAVTIWVYDDDLIRFSFSRFVLFWLLLGVPSLAIPLYPDTFGHVVGVERYVGVAVGVLIAGWFAFAGGLDRFRSASHNSVP